MNDGKKMKNGLLAYRTPKENKHPSTILYSFELELLAQILPFSYVRSTDLIDAYGAVRKKFGFSENRNAVYQRLHQLKERGILAHTCDKGRIGYQLISELYYYGLTTKGYRLLADADVITEAEAETYIRLRRRFKRHSLHTNTCIKLTLSLFAELKEHPLFPTFEVMKGIHHEWFKEKEQVINGQLISLHPDVLVEFENTIIAFEVDGGKQGKDVIANKRFRYNEIAKLHSQEGKQLFVVFVPIDGDLAFEYTTLCNRRMVTLKEILSEQKEKAPNLEYYVLPSREIFSFIERVANATELPTAKYKDNFLLEWRTELELNMNSLNYRITPISEEAFVINPHRMQRPLSKEFLPDYAFRFKLADKKPEHYFICAMRPGNISDFRKYQNMLHRIEAINKHERIPFDVRFIALYETEEGMRNDVLAHPSNYADVEVFGTNHTEWIQHSINVTDFTKAPLPFYELHKREQNFQRYKEGYHF